VRFGGNTSCLELRSAHGELLVLDAGTGIRGLGAALLQEGDLRPIHLLLTHLHADHVLGLPHFVPLIALPREAGREAVRVIAGAHSALEVEALLTAMATPPLFPAVDGLLAQLRYVDWPGSAPYEVGTLRVQRWPARHPGGAAIFRVDDSVGALCAFAPDNELSGDSALAEVRAWRAALVSFLHGVPLLIHDATYTADEARRFTAWGHSSAHEATQLAMECEAETLALFHHHPDRDDHAIDRLLDDCRTLVHRAGSALRLFAASEGLVLQVPSVADALLP